MPMDLNDLTPAKIAAMQAGSLTNAYVAAALGFDVYQDHDGHAGWRIRHEDFRKRRHIPGFSTDANAAHEAMGKVGLPITTRLENERAAVWIHLPDGHSIYCQSDTFQLATCRAILRWWLAKNGNA